MRKALFDAYTAFQKSCSIKKNWWWKHLKWTGIKCVRKAEKKNGARSIEKCQWSTINRRKWKAFLNFVCVFRFIWWNILAYHIWLIGIWSEINKKKQANMKQNSSNGCNDLCCSSLSLAFCRKLLTRNSISLSCVTFT